MAESDEKFPKKTHKSSIVVGTGAVFTDADAEITGPKLPISIKFCDVTYFTKVKDCHLTEQNTTMLK